MTINERIFNTLESKNLKQADLARKLNVRTSVIASWKTRGSNPPIEYAAQICEFLNITIYELLDIKSNNDIEKLDNSMEGECNLQFVGRLETPSAKIRQYYLECIAEVGEEQLEASAIYSDICIDATENKFTVSILIIGCLLLALISTAGFVFGLMKKS